jgi:hypothetical protein
VVVESKTMQVQVQIKESFRFWRQRLDKKQKKRQKKGNLGLFVL